MFTYLFILMFIALLFFLKIYIQEDLRTYNKNQQENATSSIYY